VNLSLMFRSQLQAAGEIGVAVIRNLDSLIGNLTVWGQQEHKDDGTHGDVTADSLSVTPGVSALSKVRLNQVTYEHTALSPTVNNLTVPGLSTSSCLRIVPNQVLDINGIDATGREPGDLLLVLNCDTTVSSPDDVWLHLENSGAVAGNRFASSSASPAGPYVLHGARGVWLVYDYQTAVEAVGVRSPRWRIVAQE
jgi:hypothetical protein